MAALITISMEIELAWGIKDKLKDKKHRFSPNRKKETETLINLISLCDKLQIPISFDIVGHLLHKKCRGNHPSPHAEGSFKIDPGTDVKSNPLFYAPDLISLIKEAETSHEICTHTYSHVLADEASQEILDWELDQVKKFHAKFGLNKPVSLVAPRHQSFPRDILKKHGIKIIRIPFSNYESKPGPLQKLYPPQPLKKTRLVDGIVETYCTPGPSLSTSMLPNGESNPSRAYSVLPTWLRQYFHLRNLKRYVKKCIEEESHLHLWTHLNNISNESQFNPISHFLTELSELRKSKKIEIITMANLAKYVTERQK